LSAAVLHAVSSADLDRWMATCGKAALAASSIRAGAADPGQRLHMQPRSFTGKAAEHDPADRRRRRQRLRDRRYRDSGRAVGGETVDAGGNGGKGHRGKAVDFGEFDGASIAGRQRGVFAPVPAVPDRTDGMNHMPRRQPISQGDFGVAGRAATKRAAFG
jgi:hypothetical protein